MGTDECQKSDAENTAVEEAVSFYVNGVKVNAVFAPKSTDTTSLVKQMLANSFAMKMSQQESS